MIDMEYISSHTEPMRAAEQVRSDEHQNKFIGVISGSIEIRLNYVNATSEPYDQH